MIILYSTSCPKCKVLEMKLKQAQIDFELIEDTDKTVEIGQQHNITSAPILQVDDTYYDFSGAINFLRGDN